jgi:hypothetical protein
VGPPPDKESIKQAEQRIAKTASSSDCDTVNGLNPISRAALNTEPRCKLLKKAAEPTRGAAQYGDAGVIDYKLGDGTLSALLVRDSDGLFHITYMNPHVPHPTVVTKLAPQFNGVATAAVDALRDDDCEAFVKVAFQEFGPGAGARDQVCAYVSNFPMSKLLQDDPKAEPKLMGGNDTFAFYGLSLRGSFWTLVLAKETPQDRFPPGVKPLPADAPEYGYVDAFRTNSAEPTTESGGSS